jgi:hypothetical protein
MGGVLRLGDRDMLQPSDLPREEKKEIKNIQDVIFLLFVEEDTFFLSLEQRVELKLDLDWYYDTGKM